MSGIAPARLGRAVTSRDVDRDGAARAGERADASRAVDRDEPSEAVERDEPSHRVDRAEAPLELDHVVVAAATLDEGVAWCEAVLGVTPAAGGRHAFMGTHNRLLSVASPRFPRSYLEVIAIDPDGVTPAQPRWFGLDETALQSALASGPRLIHWVARCRGLDAVAARFRAGGFDPGPTRAAERETATGLLTWRITVPADGRLLGAGAVPTLIEWGDAHPSTALADRGVALVDLSIGGALIGGAAIGGAPDAGGRFEASPGELLGALARVRAPAADRSAAAALRIVLDTPKGRIVLGTADPETT